MMTKNQIKTWVKNHKTQLIAAGIVGGYSLAWYLIGRKVGYTKGELKGVINGINMGAKADADFIKTNVPEAAKLVFEFTKSNPDSLCKTDLEFAKEVLKHYA